MRGVHISDPDSGEYVLRLEIHAEGENFGREVISGGSRRGHLSHATRNHFADMRVAAHFEPGLQTTVNTNAS